LYNFGFWVAHLARLRLTEQKNKADMNSFIPTDASASNAIAADAGLPGIRLVYQIRKMWLQRLGQGILSLTGRIGRWCTALGFTVMSGVAMAAGAAAGSEVPAPDAANGQKIAGAVCAACHGGDGNSPLPANPKIAGQHYDYLFKQLKEFKAVDGAPAKRANAIMAGFVANLTESDMRDLAAHFSAQKLVPASATDKSLAEAGQALYRGGDAARGLPSCMGCHGPNGAGIPGQYPALGGQYAEYTASQLTAFRQGERNNNVSMSAIAGKLSDVEIKALADYIAGLR
jgi:cytochrome c553